MTLALDTGANAGARSSAAAQITPVVVAFEPSEVAIADPELLEAVQLHLSRHLCHDRKRPPGPSLVHQAMLLREYVRVELPDVEAPLPDFVPSQALPNKPLELLKQTTSVAGETITPAAIKRYWERFETLEAPPGERKLPPELLKLVLPTGYWPAIAALIYDGPQVAKRRWNLWLLDRRDAGSVRTSTLRDYAFEAQRLMSDCLALHSAHPAFEPWSWRPELSPPSAVNEPLRRSSVDLPCVRLALNELRRELCQRLGCQLGQELEAIKGLSSSQLRGRNLFDVTRKWAVVHTLAVTGARIESGLALQVEHYRRQHRSGYGSCPTLMLEPNKTWDDGDVSLKPLGGNAAYPLEVFLAYREGLLGRELQGSEPLYPAGQRGDAAHRRVGYAAVHKWLAGSLAKPENAGGLDGDKETRVRLVEQALESERKAAAAEGRPARTRGWFPLRHRRRRRRIFIDEHGYVGETEALLPIEPDRNPFRGHSSRDLRKLASQQLETPKCRNWLEREKPEFQHPHRYLSEILLNHSLDRRSIEDIYKITPQIADRITGTAIEYLDRLLYTDLGARMVQSPERYRAALLERRALNSRQKRLSDERARLRAQLERQAISVEEFLQRSDELSEQLDQVRTALEQREEEIRGIREDDPRYRVPLNDDENEVSKAEIDERLAEVHLEVEGRREFDAPMRDRVRNWLTLLEFARVAGVSQRQVSRWTRGESLPAKTPPWSAEHPPVDESLGPKRRRIAVEELSAQWLDEVPARRDRIEDILCDWPTEEHWHRHRVAEVGET